MTTPSDEQPRRKQAEAESQRLLNEAQFERDRLAALLASMRDEVWFADTQGRFTLANPAALQELATDLPIDGEALAAGIEVFWADGSPRPIEASTALRALNGEHLINEEEIIRTPASGELRYRQVSAAPVRDQTGRIIGSVSVARDITERKHAERALQEASRRKDAFLATLSHELRNPLAPLRAGLDVLQARSDEGSADDGLLQIMDRQLSHLVRLVDDLLDLSRINNAKIQLRKERLDLAQVAQAALEISDNRLRQDGRQLRVNLPSEPLMVEGDRVRLVQIIANLLNNAAKFTEAGGHISLELVAQEDQVAIRIQDDGQGIPAEQLDAIFEPFLQTEPARGGGLGLGLTLVRSLVALHGGTVTASSEGAGCGAALTVSLPLAPCAQSAPGHLDKAAPDPIAHYRVLVVDDNPDVAEAQEMLLTSLNAEVRVTHSGVEALQVFAQWSPTLVLMDIGMPGMDGYEVARRLRAQHAERAFRLVAITGWGQDEDRRKAQEAGFDQLLLKPVRAAELKTVLSTMDAVLDGIAARHQ